MTIDYIISYTHPHIYIWHVYIHILWPFTGTSSTKSDKQKNFFLFRTAYIET